ncbi:pentatricopeptide repeat-containing protein [Canna indica]|uniref:Pentatricopeptide repeat-containing protein n=1 Tax=Canna indica TaxID=4628 RepID=A0AAQ3L7I5_9LILI|nr:pentatricopeptide repeat-containing protein [Canna indica]
MLECAKAGNLTVSLQFLQLLEPSILDYNGLLYHYFRSDAGLQKLPKLQRHRQVPSFGAFQHPTTEPRLSGVFNGFCALGYLEDAFLVLDEMCSQRFVPYFKSLRKLMKKSLASARLELSVEVLRLMLKFDHLPPSPDVNGMIIKLIRGGRICQAYEVFSILLGKNFIPNIFTCNSILFSLCKSGQSYVTLSLFYSLRKKGFSPNVYSYTAIVLGFSKEGLWKEAYCVLKQMQDEDCMPTVVTYTIVIKFLCIYNKFREAFDIFKTMDKKGCPPDLVTCNVVLHALCYHGSFTEAYNFIQVMQEKGFIPDQFSYSALASGLLKARFVNKSTDLLSQVIFEGNNTVDVVTLNVYFHSLCCNGKVKKVQGMIKSMMEKGFVPLQGTRYD